MKEIKILSRVDEVTDKIETLIYHRGFPKSVNDYSVSQILETIGILEALKKQMLDKLASAEAKVK